MALTACKNCKNLLIENHYSEWGDYTENLCKAYPHEKKFDSYRGKYYAPDYYSCVQMNVSGNCAKFKLNTDKIREEKRSDFLSSILLIFGTLIVVSLYILAISF